MTQEETQTVKAPAHPVGRPRQGLTKRLIFTQTPAKVQALVDWLESHPETDLSSFLREAYDDAMKKHGIVA